MMRETKDLVRLFPTSYKKEKSFSCQNAIFFKKVLCKKNLHFESVVVLLQSFSNDLSKKKKELYIFTNTQNIR